MSLCLDIEQGVMRYASCFQNLLGAAVATGRRPLRRVVAGVTQGLRSYFGRFSIVIKALSSSLSVSMSEQCDLRLIETVSFGRFWPEICSRLIELDFDLVKPKRMPRLTGVVGPFEGDDEADPELGSLELEEDISDPQLSLPRPTGMSS